MSMPRQLSLAVVGADYPNGKGQPPRRFAIAMCNPGEPVELRPEPKNPADPQAIAVFTSQGVQIGYVRAERAPLIGTLMRRHEVQAIFQCVEPWGCTIRVAADEVPTLPDPDHHKSQDWPPPDSQN